MMKHLLTATALCGLAFGATPVVAGPIVIESIRSQNLNQYQREDRPQCSEPYNDPGSYSSSAIAWKPGDDAIYLSGEGKMQFEVYAHWLDTWEDDKNNTSLTGIPEASAKYLKGFSGITNNLRGCGAIGSAVIEINLGRVPQIRNGFLKIADARSIPIRVYNKTAYDVVWDDNNFATGDAASAEGSYQSALAEYNRNLPTRQAEYEACLAAEAPRKAQYEADRAAAEAERRASGSTSVTIPGASGFRSQCRAPTPPQRRSTLPEDNTIAACADSQGLDSRIVGRRLVMTLPTHGLSADCARKHLRLNFEYGVNPTPYGIIHKIPGGGPPPVTFTHNGNGPVPGFSIVASATQGYYGKVNFRPEELQGLVGEYKRQITVNPGGEILNLTIKSTPDYGVKALKPPLTLPNAIGRLNSSLVLTVDTVQATYPGQVFVWQASGDGAQGCFTSLRGETTPPANVMQFPVTLTAAEAAGCAGKTFTVTVGPRDQPTGTVFARTASFVLARLNAPLLQNSDKRLTGAQNITIPRP